jgi:hypothetical protein
MLATAAMLAAPAAHAQFTSNNLSVSPSGTVASGTVVTLTATVSLNVGSFQYPPHGVITFCDTTGAQCADQWKVGTAEVSGGYGTAAIKIIPGVGIHKYQARFPTTVTSYYGNPNYTYFGSYSNVVQVTVNATGSALPTTATISSSGSGPYTLAATVLGIGTELAAPTGLVNFLDETLGNSVLGSATLGTATPYQAFAPQVTYPVGSTPALMGVGDGTALSSTQLDATANVPGTFVYNPAAGTIPADGSDTLSVTFTPTDTTDYNSATATVTLAVEGFTLTTTAGGTTSQTVAAGAAASFNFIVSPVGSARLVSAVTLSLSGLPAGATYKFTPEVIPAGSPATGVDLVIQTSPGGSSASWNMEPPDDGPQRGTTILLTLVLLPWLAIRSLRRQKRFASGLLAAVLFAGLTLGVTVGLGGCAASPQPRTYYLVVTETSSTVTHSFNLTLTVK